MKIQIHPSSRPQARLGGARSINSHRRRACLGLLAGCCGVLAGLAWPTRAAVTEAWAQRYSNVVSNSTAVASKVICNAAGDIIVTGYTQDDIAGPDMLTIKYSGANGSLIWQQRYNGPGNGGDYANAVAVDRSGNAIVTGYSYNGEPNYNPDYYTAKYAAADGALLWEKRYNGSGNGSDYANAVAVDGSGNVLVTGVSDNGIPANADYYTAKYTAADGELLWEKRYDGPANNRDEARSVAVDGNGNVVVTGDSYSGTTPDYYTAKYAAADGALLWEKRYNGPTQSWDSGTAVVVDGGGNVVVTGSSYSEMNVGYYTAKYAAADGTLLWEQRSEGNDGKEANSVAVDGSGNVVVAGGAGHGWCTECGADYYTVKYAAADGALLWEKRYNSTETSGDPLRSDDRARAVAVDGNGNVVVTGYSFNGTNDYDYYTAKYAAANGALLWEKRYNGGIASSLALGPNGMVAITGTSDGDYATVVYRENLPPVAIDVVPTGVRIRFGGVPGRNYTIERAPAATGPWNTIVTPTAPIGGIIEYIDTNPPISSAFYRTSTL